MKKFLFVVVIILLVSVFKTYSQNEFEPCLPDCFSDTWYPDLTQPALKLDVIMCGTTISILYRHRIACNQWYDYYIEGVAGEYMYQCMRDEYSGDIAAFLQAVTEKLIVANPASFPPDIIGDCEPMWRVMKGGCFFEIKLLSVPGGIEINEKSNSHSFLSTPPYDPFYGSSFDEVAYNRLAPCPSIHCCLEHYTVCLTSGGLTITATGYQPPMNPECENDYHYYCYPVCGSVYNR